MSAYNYVSMACVKSENTVWGWELVNAAKSQENVREFYNSWRVVNLC